MTPKKTEPDGTDPRVKAAIESTPRQEGYAAVLAHIVGDTPLLMHRPDITSMGRRGRGRAEIPTAEEEAAKAAYWTADKSSLCIPATALEQMMIRACQTERMAVGKQSLTPLIAGGMTVYPEEVPLGKKDYEVDVRRVFVQRQGILRARPKVMPWDLWFTVEWRPDNFPRGEKGDLVEGVIRDLLRVGGIRIGLLDYRPEKRGRFGRFHLASLEAVP